MNRIALSMAFIRTFARLLPAFALTVGVFAADTPRPNILWLTSEDHGPHMGCYGDKLAVTPNVDALAAKGLLYTKCWSNAPVCAPARTTIITGMYPTSLGAEHMRSMVPFPAGKKMFPQFLREAGYYCTNNAKEDYNIEKPGKVWDESSGKAHWRNRGTSVPAVGPAGVPPAVSDPAGRMPVPQAQRQPFFAVFNSLKSHESQIRTRPHKQVLDPAKVRVPAYHPDTPEVRQDWAQYYDKVSEADADAGKRLKELEDAGLTEDTIVFYYADHGSGMPRSKRWPYNSGLHVPLVVYIPEKFAALRPPEYKAGGKSDRLVSFVDLAPTMLSLIGVQPPDWMQGHAFLGKFITEPQPFLHGFRGRMDERLDLVRSVTDGRYVYVRNYMPHLIYGQHLNYMWQTPTTRVWEQLHKEGKLNAVQDKFWNPKPPEELFDLQSNPDEVVNLADSKEYAEIKGKLREAQIGHAGKINDAGFLPEGERLERSKGSSLYDFGFTLPIGEWGFILETAHSASDLSQDLISRGVAREFLQQKKEPALRYWVVLAFHMRGRQGVEDNHDALSLAMKDPSTPVRIAAARALVEFGTEADAQAAFTVLLDAADWSKNDVFTAMSALDALNAVGQKAAPYAARIKSLPAKGPAPDPRYKEYIPRILAELRERFP
jgi:uncharacterized sulfatase